METRPIPDAQPVTQQPNAQVGASKTFIACVAGLLIPGFGHAVLRKWDRAAVFFGSITIMLGIGIRLQGRLFDPVLGDIFSTLKFIAEAGAGLLYWVPWMGGMGGGDPTAYTYDYANVFIYVAGLLNMLVVVDAFDIAMGRKQ